MPLPNTETQAVAEAVLKKEQVGPPATPEAKLASQVRRQMAAEGPRSALEVLRQRKPPEEGVITRLTENNIGTERKPDGSKRRNTEETKRFEDATKYAKIAQELFKKGYDKIAEGDPNQNTIKQEVRSMVESVVMAWPEAAAMLGGMNAAARKEVIENMLQSPEFSGKLKAAFEGAIDPSKTLVDIVSEAKKKFDDAKQKEDQKQAEVDRNTGEFDRITTELKAYNPGESAALELEDFKAGKPNDINELTQRRSALAIDVEGARDDIASLKRGLTNAESRGDNARADNIRSLLDARRTEFRDAQAALAEVNAKINRKNELEQKKNELEAQKKKLEEEKTKLASELSNAKDARTQAQGELATAKLTRASQEQDYVDSLKGVFSDATMSYLEDRIAAAEEAQRKVIEEEKTKTTNTTEKEILDKLGTQWDKVSGKKMEFNKTTINQDYATLVAEGPQAVIKSMLEYTKATPERKAEIDAMLANKELVDKIQPQIVERLITRRVQTGKITEQEARKVIESDWGKGMIDKAIANKKELKDAVAKLREQGVIKESWGEWIKNKSGTSLIAFLLLALGSIVAVPMIGVKGKLFD